MSFLTLSSQSTLCENTFQADCVNTYLRIRPCVKRSAQYQVLKDTLWLQKNGKNNDKKSVYYSFNSIFDENCTQEEFFKTTTLPLVKEFLQGKNNLVFSYGITSSGKSYTMRGTTSHDSISPGLIPYSIFTIFNQIGSLIPFEIPTCKISKFCDVQLLKGDQFNKEKLLHESLITENNSSLSGEVFKKINCEELRRELDQCFNDSLVLGDDECCVWVSYFEIYNEQFYDLLSGSEADTRKQSTMQVVTSEKNFYLKDVTQVYVTSAVEAFSIFLKGQENLHVEATNLNEHSSRSHSVFTLSLLKTNKVTKETAISKLCFGDLAGNERIKKIGLGKIVETANINKSLMTLSRCIQELKNRSTVIPVRESNLTKVFQPYLKNTGGKMSLIYNLNPSEHLFEESSFSLDFCKASQKISQKQIDEFRRTVESKENIPSEANVCLQKIRKSISIITLRDSNSNNEEIEELRKQLKECTEKFEQSQRDNSKIFADAEKILVDARKAFKREIQIREERFILMEEMYKEKCASLEEKIEKLVQENYDLSERLANLDTKIEQGVQKSPTQISNLDIEKINITDLNCKENFKASFISGQETLGLLPETPDFIRSNELDSTTRTSYDIANSIERYKTPIKPKRKAKKKSLDDSTVDCYLASAKKARQPIGAFTPEKSFMTKRIELPRTAQKLLAVETSVTDVCEEIVQTDKKKPTLRNKRYNTRSRTHLNQ